MTKRIFPIFYFISMSSMALLQIICLIEIWLPFSGFFRLYKFVLGLLLSLLLLCFCAFSPFLGWQLFYHPKQECWAWGTNKTFGGGRKTCTNQAEIEERLQTSLVKLPTFHFRAPSTCTSAPGISSCRHFYCFHYCLWLDH